MKPAPALLWFLLQLNHSGSPSPPTDFPNGIDICPWTGRGNPTCGVKEDQYRTLDGSCNTRLGHLLGKSRTPMQRILESAYGRNNLPRSKGNGEELPSARFISNQVFESGDPKNGKNISTLFVQMWQFLDHDMIYNPTPEQECCKKDPQGRGWVFPSGSSISDSDGCFSIKVPSDDPFWGSKGRTCMEFSRTSVSPSLPNCDAGRREQINANTHWLDASNVYGSTQKESRELREFKSFGRLKAFTRFARDLLPQCSKATSNRIEACKKVCTKKSNGCVFAGDSRVNVQPGLSTLHTLWLREHNRVAGELKHINNEWGGEKVFQETRRIVIGQWQHIIYNEWLPILLGLDYMTLFDILPTREGYSQDSDTSLDPRINNEFAAAAFRFGHSMIPSHLPSRDSEGKDTSSNSLRSVFYKPDMLQQRGFIESMLRGLALEDAPALDSSFSEDILNHMYEDEINGGTDQAALNIQRGRDHGIPGYNEYRGVCQSGNYGAVDDFDGLSADGYLTRDDIRKLRNVYDKVEDIDIFVGGILEKPHGDSLVGPVFKCIIGDQFIRSRQEDRFWYENGEDPATRFSVSQLMAIRQSSMARIICDNSDIQNIQPLVFRSARGGNSRVDCNSGIVIPRVDLGQWREQK